MLVRTEENEPDTGVEINNQRTSLLNQAPCPLERQLLKQASATLSLRNNSLNSVLIYTTTSTQATLNEHLKMTSISHCSLKLFKAEYSVRKKKKVTNMLNLVGSTGPISVPG